MMCVNARPEQVLKDSKKIQHVESTRKQTLQTDTEKTQEKNVQTPERFVMSVVGLVYQDLK